MNFKVSRLFDGTAWQNGSGVQFSINSYNFLSTSNLKGHEPAPFYNEVVIVSLNIFV